MERLIFLGSPNPSPVLNLSKNASGGSAGSPGDADHSGSEPEGPDGAPSPRSPTHSGPEDEEDDNISDPEDDDEKDQGELYPSNRKQLIFFLSKPTTDFLKTISVFI